MITAEEARIETIKYTEEPFDFVKRSAGWFERQYENELNLLKFSIEEQAKKKNYYYEIDMKIDDKILMRFFKLDEFIYKEYCKNKLSKLTEYLVFNKYKVQLKEITRKKLFKAEKIIGFKYKISWEE